MKAFVVSSYSDDHGIDSEVTVIADNFGEAEQLAEEKSKTIKEEGIKSIEMISRNVVVKQ